MLIYKIFGKVTHKYFIYISYITNLSNSPESNIREIFDIPPCVLNIFVVKIFEKVTLKYSIHKVFGKIILKYLDL